MTEASHASLLRSGDPDPVDLVNAQSSAPIFLLCEHAGRAIPSSLKNLGLDEPTLRSHRGWDIGAEALARALADRLNAPLILQRYSRLVIDANRPPRSAESILQESDGVLIAANSNLSPREVSARVEAIFDPMETAIKAAFAKHPRKATFSIHSFTPVLGGKHRPWNAGFLTRKCMPVATSIIASLHRQMPHLTLAINEPYRIDDETDWFIPHHAEARGLPHCLIEVRNDQIVDETGVSLWADLLGHALEEFMKELK